MKLVTVDEMRRIEAASDAHGHTYAQMMEHAGSAVARVIQARLDVRGQRILIIVGPGNNGGDGLVAARQLHDAGAQVGVFMLKPREDEHAASLRMRGVSITLWSDKALREWLNACAVIVDALLGTGTARPIGGDLANLLLAVKQVAAARRSVVSDLVEPAWPLRSAHAVSQPKAGRRAWRDVLPLIVAVDGPTGLNYDTGEIDPPGMP